MTQWTHLFPSRTEKLSTVVAKVAQARIARRWALFLCYFGTLLGIIKFMETKLFTKEKFSEVLKSFSFDETKVDFLYDVYETVIDGIDDVAKSANHIDFAPVNNYVVILYILNEYKFLSSEFYQSENPLITSEDDFFDILASICADKYLTNEQLNYKSEAFLNKFNPPISTLDLYLNFCLRSLDKIQSADRNSKLISDLLKKAFKMSKCILSLLINGFETEAFSTWRTLHENECIILCLIKNGSKMYDAYFKHITYALAYRGQIDSKEQTDEIFVQIKQEMKEKDLKSKDMKKFIEYGYLYYAKNLDKFENFKLNFRDGVENIAGLKDYSKVYEMASEIAHSSPLLLYSKKSYFFEITVLNLYESFFRIEKIFEVYYKNHVTKSDFEAYKKMKSIYMNQLIKIHDLFVENFLKTQVVK